MSTVQETVIALEFLISLLSLDSELQALAPGGVFRAMAPPNTATPFVIVALQSGMDVLTGNAYRIMSNLLYQVKVVAPADMTAQIASAANRIDDLLRLTSGTVTGGIILSSYRESPLQVDEIVAGELWCNWGGLYRMLVQQAS